MPHTATDIAVHRSAGLPNFLRIIIGLIAATIGCLASRGNGVSPLLYFLFGLIGIPLLMAKAAAGAKRRRPTELVIASVGGALCFAAAYGSSRQSGSTVFRSIFDEPVPASVHALSVRNQWYDGPMSLATFEISQTDFDALVTHARLKADASDDRPMEPDRAASAWLMAVGQWGGLAYDFWPRHQQIESLRVYRRDDSANGEPNGLIVAREPPSNRVWAVRLR